MLHTMQLMPIGRFSRLTGVGVKALRHYDEVGLLVPAAVDDETGYRFYSPDPSASTQLWFRVETEDGRTVWDSSYARNYRYPVE